MIDSFLGWMPPVFDPQPPHPQVDIGIHARVIGARPQRGGSKRSQPYHMQFLLNPFHHLLHPTNFEVVNAPVPTRRLTYNDRCTINSPLVPRAPPSTRYQEVQSETMAIEYFERVLELAHDLTPYVSQSMEHNPRLSFIIRELNLAIHQNNHCTWTKRSNSRSIKSSIEFKIINCVAPYISRV